MSIRWCALQRSSIGSIAEIENAPGIVLFTLVDSDLSKRLEAGLRSVRLAVLVRARTNIDVVQILPWTEFNAESRRATYA